MPDFLPALPNGSANLWIFISTAILLGSLALYMAWQGWRQLHA